MLTLAGAQRQAPSDRGQSGDVFPLAARGMGGGRANHRNCQQGDATAASLPQGRPCVTRANRQPPLRTSRVIGGLENKLVRNYSNKYFMGEVNAPQSDPPWRMSQSHRGPGSVDEIINVV